MFFSKVIIIFEEAEMLVEPFSGETDFILGGEKSEEITDDNTNKRTTNSKERNSFLFCNKIIDCYGDLILIYPILPSVFASEIMKGGPL